MLWVVLLLGASGMVGGYAAERAIIPKLQYRPGTPNEIVETCRQAAIAAARTHATEVGAQLIRVDATSAGEMRRTRSSLRAPVEVGIVYSRSNGREARHGVIECRVDRRGQAAISDLAIAAR
jgi:enoyl-[acyl-carrier-protein] reductase (NADH)